MRSPSVFTSLIILGLLFISIGDRILPEPLSTASTQTRISLEQFLMGSFPKWQPVNANARTEEAIKELGQGSN
jgi:hypothetical protein